MVSVNAIKFLDKYIGFLTCIILSINKLFPKKSIETKNILLIQLWGLGESILTLPTIKTLREKYPKSKIDILVTDRNKDVYFNNKNLDDTRVISLNPFAIKWFMLKNFRKYDLVIDMEEYLNISSIMSFSLGKNRIGYNHGVRSLLYTKTIPYNDKQHVVYTFLNLLKPLNIKLNVDKLSKLNYSSKNKKNIDNLLKKFNIGKKDFIVGIAPGAAESAKSRMWLVKNYAELCNNILLNKKNKIIFIGNKYEGELIKKIQNSIKEKIRTFNTAGLFNLNGLFYLIEKCNLFIGNDTGPMHIAAAQGVKTIGLFGPNLPVRFGPYGKDNISVYKGHNCQYNPCINVHKGEVPNCLFAKNIEHFI